MEMLSSFGGDKHEFCLVINGSFLLKNCFAIPKLLHKLSSAPCLV